MIDDALELGEPSVLVMIEGTIDEAQVPATVKFLVPESAELYSAGSGPRETYTVGGNLTRESSNITGWDEVIYELETNTFVLEYYDPIEGEEEKTTSVEFRPSYPLGNLTVQIVQNPDTEDFEVTPSSSEVIEDDNGYNIYYYTYTSVEADDPIAFDISYKPASDDSNNWPVILGVAAAFLIAFALGVIWLRRNSSDTPSKKQDQKSKKERRKEKKASKEPETSRFCTECGAELTKSSRFCPNCGAKVRQ